MIVMKPDVSFTKNIYGLSYLVKRCSLSNSIYLNSATCYLQNTCMKYDGKEIMKMKGWEMFQGNTNSKMQLQSQLYSKLQNIELINFRLQSIIEKSRLLHNDKIFHSPGNIYYKCIFIKYKNFKIYKEKLIQLQEHLKIT